MSKAQHNKILRHIREAGHITNKQAMVDYSIASLSRRITDLETLGFKFAREWASHPTTGQRYVRYRFAEGSARSMGALNNEQRTG